MAFISQLTLALAFISTLAACSQPESVMGSNAEIELNAENNRLIHRASITQFGLAGTRRVALTIDDGPSVNTHQILDLLKRENVKATFFMIGRHIPGHEGALRRMAAEGHILANHTYNHQMLAAGRYRANPNALISELLRTHQAIAPYMVSGQKLYFRAPFGAWNSLNAAILNSNPVIRQYVGPIHWTAGGAMQYGGSSGMRGAADWSCWGRVSVATCAQGYLNEITEKGGAVILAHELDNRSVQMLAQLIPALKARGYQFVRLDQMNSLQDL